MLLRDPSFKTNQEKVASLILEQIKLEALKPQNPFPFETTGSYHAERQQVEAQLQ